MESARLVEEDVRGGLALDDNPVGLYLAQDCFSCVFLILSIEAMYGII
jgi:hypothetical protein